MLKLVYKDINFSLQVKKFQLQKARQHSAHRIFWLLFFVKALDEKIIVNMMKIGINFKENKNLLTFRSLEQAPI
jgi:hypothetical protein